MAAAPVLLSALSRAFALSTTHSSGDPELAEALEDVREIHHAMGWVVIRVEGEGFQVLDETVSVRDGDLATFRKALQDAHLEEIRLQEVLEPEVLEDFLIRIRPPDDGEPLPGPERFRGLEAAVGLSFRTASVPPKGMAGSIQDLFSGLPGEDGAEAAREGEDETEAEGEAEVEDGAEDGTKGLEAPAREAAPQVTADSISEPPPPAPPPPPTSPESLGGVDVEAFFSAPSGQRSTIRGEILAAAGGLREARDNATLVKLVEALAGPREGGQPDPEALELAREILTPSIASYLVARLGETRDEEERNRMTGICAGLGREVALALADALGEARDRYQRRSFMDAMMAQGSVALEVAKGMLEDPRWFVVRNGVSLMGEMGGEDAVSDLTGSLANPDARVRRETVLALAKLGGTDAEQLLLGMLDDQEVEVRAMACRAVGVLAVEKALKPLMRILDEEQSEDVLVECLQALGKIGDPGAVPLIEKKALGGLFSRPSKELRIAAYRALAGIGTPHARSLLEKAAKDSDVSVRTVAQSLLK